MRRKHKKSISFKTREIEEDSDDEIESYLQSYAESQGQRGGEGESGGRSAIGIGMGNPNSLIRRVKRNDALDLAKKRDAMKSEGGKRKGRDQERERDVDRDIDRGIQGKEGVEEGRRGRYEGGRIDGRSESGERGHAPPASGSCDASVEVCTLLHTSISFLSPSLLLPPFLLLSHLVSTYLFNNHLTIHPSIDLSPILSSCLSNSSPYPKLW